MVKVGIIGGSGLDDPQILSNSVVKEVTTPYGDPSSALTCGTIKGVAVVLLSRHGKDHEHTPTGVNYRANIWALKEEGCTHILATTAVGSLREEIGRGHFVILDQFIDFTRHRSLSFHDSFSDGVVHTPMATPFCDELRDLLSVTSHALGYPTHDSGTVVTIEGPRFSTKAESHMFRSFGADVINMSVAPECALANEAKLPYAAVAMSTDYDCWKEDEAPVSWDEVLKTFYANVDKVVALLVAVVPKVAALAGDPIKSKIRTIPNYPKDGIMFRDITTLLQDPVGLELCVDRLVERYKGENLDVICGIDSRGFIFGGVLAHKLGVGFVPIRKKGKLPAATISETYSLEYGFDELEIHKDSITPTMRVLIVDDLIATAGTALAACNLVRKLGGDIVGCAFVVELPELAGREKLTAAGYSVFSLVTFDGH